MVIRVGHRCVKGNVRRFEKYKVDDSDHGKEQNVIITIEPTDTHSWCVDLFL